MTLAMECGEKKVQEKRMGGAAEKRMGQSRQVEPCIGKLVADLRGFHLKDSSDKDFAAAY